MHHKELLKIISIALVFVTCNKVRLLHAQYDISSTTDHWILQGHVLKLLNFTTLFGCFMECTEIYNCYSLNFYLSEGLCELNNATNWSHPNDFVRKKIPSLHLLNSLHEMPCSDGICGSDKRCFGEHGRAQQCRECAIALGLEDRTIPDSAMSASSAYLGRLESAALARLNTNRFWTASHIQIDDWLQVDFGKVTMVGKVATQGFANPAVLKYVSKYLISSSMDQQNWQEYKENGIVKVFNGNFDSTTVVTNSFKEKIITRYIRLIVKGSHNLPTLRLEYYGCHFAL